MLATTSDLYVVNNRVVDNKREQNLFNTSIARKVADAERDMIYYKSTQQHVCDQLTRKTAETEKRLEICKVQQASVNNSLRQRFDQNVNAINDCIREQKSANQRLSDRAARMEVELASRASAQAAFNLNLSDRTKCTENKLDACVIEQQKLKDSLLEATSSINSQREVNQFLNNRSEKLDDKVSDANVKIGKVESNAGSLEKDLQRFYNVLQEFNTNLNALQRRVDTFEKQAEIRFLSQDHDNKVRLLSFVAVAVIAVCMLLYK